MSCKRSVGSNANGKRSVRARPVRLMCLAVGMLCNQQINDLQRNSPTSDNLLEISAIHLRMRFLWACRDQPADTYYAGHLGEFITATVLMSGRLGDNPTKVELLGDKSISQGVGALPYMPYTSSDVGFGFWFCVCMCFLFGLVFVFKSQPWFAILQGI